jgi:hypothetical protein
MDWDVVVVCLPDVWHLSGSGGGVDGQAKPKTLNAKIKERGYKLVLTHGINVYI